MQTFIDKEFVSPPEAGAILGVSRVHALTLIHQGKLPAQRVGPKYLIVRLADVLRLKAQREAVRK